jgi:hypothetical protein
MALSEVCVRRRLDRGATTKTRGPARSPALEPLAATIEAFERFRRACGNCATLSVS